MSRGRARRSIAVVYAALVASTVSAAAPAERFDLAITVDDLPVHGELPPGITRRDVASSFLRTLAAHGLPEAFGFVNARGLEQEPGTMGRADWRWFRFPNLADGSEPERRRGAAAFLTARGYRIAHVSVAFADWSYSDAYSRCLVSGDDAAIERLRAQYLRGVDQAIARMKAVSRCVYGRIVPQVLLTHIGAWTAATLPEVMARLDAAGARYITLAQAQAHPVYVEAEANGGGGGSVMERAARQRGIDLSDIPAPTPPNSVRSLCR